MEELSVSLTLILALTDAVPVAERRKISDTAYDFADFLAKREDVKYSVRIVDLPTGDIATLRTFLDDFIKSDTDDEAAIIFLTDLTQEKNSDNEKNFFVNPLQLKNVTLFYTLQMFSQNATYKAVRAKNPRSLLSLGAIVGASGGAAHAVVGGVISSVVGPGAVAIACEKKFSYPQRLLRFLVSDEGDDGIEDTFFRRMFGKIFSTPAKQKIRSVRDVQFSAVMPETIFRGKWSLVDIVMYEENFRNFIEQVRAERNTPVRVTTGGYYSVADRTKVRIVLTCPEVEMNPAAIEEEWTGKVKRFSFNVRVPQNFAAAELCFNAKVFFDGLHTTTLTFTVAIESPVAQMITTLRRDILSAFVSYAHEDISRVLIYIAGIKKYRPDLDIFIDRANLRSGENWQTSLLEQIARRDVFYLFWSRNACKSEYVEREWRYALQHKGLNSIEPMPIDPPELAPPPTELNSLHFADTWLYFSNLA